jgi:NAD(P)-dependent dehydrogenase (short-subunit alcohol dehydrogenase family)
MESRTGNPNLSGQVAIVTGGGRGIGRAIAKAIAAAGGRVCVVARSDLQVAEVVSEIKGTGGVAIGAATDVTDWAAVQHMVETTEERLGPPTLLVNNAGSADGLGRIDSVDPQSWWRDIEVSLKGSFLCCRQVVPGMVARHAGRVINISSDVGIHPSPDTSSYACSRAALLRLTDSLAAETTGNGVSVFAISPGLVRTALTDHVLSTGPGQLWFSRIKSPNWVEPERGAQMVVLLASGKADVLSGRYLRISDNIGDLVARVEEIRQTDLYTLTVRRL